MIDQSKKKEHQDHITEICPLCGKITETQDHVLQCTDPHVKTFKIVQLNKITNWCRERKTYYLATKILITQLYNWIEQKDINTQTEQELSISLKIKIQETKIVHKSIQQQNQIGWNQILRGRLGQHWEILAQTRQRQNNHTSWITGLIKQIL